MKKWHVMEKCSCTLFSITHIMEKCFVPLSAFRLSWKNCECYSGMYVMEKSFCTTFSVSSVMEKFLCTTFSMVPLMECSFRLDIYHSYSHQWLLLVSRISIRLPGHALMRSRNARGVRGDPVVLTQRRQQPVPCEKRTWMAFLYATLPLCSAPRGGPIYYLNLMCALMHLYIALMHLYIALMHPCSLEGIQNKGRERNLIPCRPSSAPLHALTHAFGFCLTTLPRALSRHTIDYFT